MDIPSLRSQFDAELNAAASQDTVRAVLGRHRRLVEGLLGEVASAPREERPAMGKAANQFKRHVEDACRARLVELSRAAPAAAAIDITLPGRAPLLGHRHPLTLLRERLESIFLRFGFLIVEGPELEAAYPTFEALNMPAEHPARDMQDTLYLASPVAALDGGRAATLLRTHPSGMQIRYMETHRPPVRLIAPGRVYRRDGLDLTHSPMFTQ